MGPSEDAALRRCFEVNRGDLHLTRITESEARPPRDGEVLFDVERFGLPSMTSTGRCWAGRAARRPRRT